MKRFFIVLTCISACTSLMEVSPVMAQGRGIAATECLYSGPIGGTAGSAKGEPVRTDVDTDGRAVLLFHKIQTNYDFSNPFKPPIYAEKATCRLRLDCVVSKHGLKDIGIQSTRQEGSGDNNVWTRVGFSIAFKYADAARDTTCRIVAIDSL